MQGVRLGDLIEIVLCPSVLNGSVVILHLPGVSLERVRLNCVSLNEKRIPTTIGIDIVDHPLFAVCHHFPGLAIDVDGCNIVPGRKIKDCSSTSCCPG